jgi:predicted dithiol-disulfide oxidoreductase (DUF899 family)
MAATQPLAPAKEVAKHPFRYPNESAEYRKARTALLAEEIELRRQIEKVAEHRRALPPGGEVPRDYGFIGEQGRVRFSNLFGDKETLITYNFMFRPQRQRPCPMCTSLLSALDGEMCCICRDHNVADRASGGVQERAWLAVSQTLFVCGTGIHSRLCGPRC